MKVDTVNIIEYSDCSVLGVHSFSDDADGNKEAEQCFTTILKEQDVSDEDIEVALEEGYHEQGDYQLFITHSTAY
jgi:hypothetical protein